MLREATLSASEFKAKCLDLMAEGAARRLDRVNITKRGKPFVSLTFEPEAPARTGEEIFGCMKDWEGFIPADHDWQAPLFTDAELDAMTDDLAQQLDELMRR